MEAHVHVPSANPVIATGDEGAVDQQLYLEGTILRGNEVAHCEV